jgi:tRNA threonylcarbamoyladenosine biosynthesis protein TsaE
MKERGKAQMSVKMLKNNHLSQEWTSTSEHDTAALADRLQEFCADYKCVTLSGPLGAGKSVFARSLIRSRADDPQLIVPSPTFTLLQTYETPHGVIWHFDLYRLQDHSEIYELGWDEALSGALILVEWPQRLGPLLPLLRLELDFQPMGPQGDHRIIRATPHQPPSHDD